MSLASFNSISDKNRLKGSRFFVDRPESNRIPFATIGIMDETPRNEPAITKLLNRWREGDPAALDAVIEYVYSDLRRRATAYLKRERQDHTLQPTGLVHEAFIKLVEKREIEWQDRNHFIAVGAQVMRRILVDHARGRNREKRGGKFEDIPLDEALPPASSRSSIDLIALDEALNKLAVFDERQAKIVELKYFGGMTLDETASILDISEVTVKRDWQIARAWLRNQLQ